MTPPRPRADRRLEILSTSKRSMDTETSSTVTWRGGDFVVWLLRTYCVIPGGKVSGEVGCVVGVGARYAGGYRHATVGVSARHVVREVQI